MSIFNNKAHYLQTIWRPNYVTRSNEYLTVMSMEYLIHYKHSLKIWWKSIHFLGRYKRKRERVFFSDVHSVLYVRVQTDSEANQQRCTDGVVIHQQPRHADQSIDHHHDWSHRRYKHKFLTQSTAMDGLHINTTTIMIRSRGTDTVPTLYAAIQLAIRPHVAFQDSCIIIIMADTFWVQTPGYVPKKTVGFLGTPT